MHVKMLDIFDNCSKWDDYVENHPAATVYHLSAWGRAVSASMGHKCYYITVEDQGKVCALIPLIHIKSRLFGNSLISVGFATGGGPPL